MDGRESLEALCIVVVTLLFAAFFGMHHYAKSKTLTGDVTYTRYIVMPLFWWTYLVGSFHDDSNPRMLCR